MFCIVTESEHDTVLVLDRHEMSRPLQGNIERERMVNQVLTQPRAPTSILKTSAHDNEDSNDVWDDTEVRPLEASIDVSQYEERNYFLRYLDGHVDVLIPEKYADSGRRETDGHGLASHDSSTSHERSINEGGDQVVSQEHRTHAATQRTVCTAVKEVTPPEQYDELRTGEVDGDVQEQVPAIGTKRAWASLSVSPLLVVYLP